MFTTLVAALFALFLVGEVPTLSYLTTRGSRVQHLPRSALYASAIISQWLLTVLGLGVVLLVARRVLSTGFGATPWLPVVRWAGLVTLLALLMQGLVILLERRGWLPKEADLVVRLMPLTSRERIWSVLVLAPTAAFCEEFLFRGFLLTQLTCWTQSVAWAWIGCSAAFGLAHCYQGWSGTVRAGLLGAFLAYPVVKLGSLYPSILAHWAIDAIALVGLGRWLVSEKISGKGKSWRDDQVSSRTTTTPK